MAFNPQLCVRPTPIHRWDVPGLPKEFQLFIKRDDMTGSTLGGNKVRIFLMTDESIWKFWGLIDSSTGVPDG